MRCLEPYQVRIVLDLQGTQSVSSRYRGIGRYSFALAQAIALEGKSHEIWLALNGRLPDSIEWLRREFASLIPAERIRVFDLPGPVAEMQPLNRWRTQAAELLREKFLFDLKPDWVHASTLFDGFTNEAVLSIGRLNAPLPTAVTLYDLIPLLEPERHLIDQNFRRAYFRRIQSLKRADLLLAISESSRHDAIEKLQISSDRIATIGAGVDPFFRPVKTTEEVQAALLNRYHLDRPFLLYTGGVDPHKNLLGLLAGFALVPRDFRIGYQLAIVGRIPPEEQHRFTGAALRQGLNPDEIVFTGFVTDEDLRLLYNLCTLFVLPSFQEGFGLPALEAMACGAPVLGSNTKSIPEIINRQDALFNPREPKDIGQHLFQVLTDPDFRRNLGEWGIERAKTFTWRTSARTALDALEETHLPSRSAKSFTFYPIDIRRPFLAFLSPTPPGKTAKKSLLFLPNLAKYYEIVCVTDQPNLSDPWILAEFPVRSFRWFEENARKMARILYHFNKDPLEAGIFYLQERYPGVAILEDFFLGEAFASLEARKPGILTEALYDSHGFFGLIKNQTEGRGSTTANLPCNAAILRSSVGVIACSRDAPALARQWYGNDDRIKEGAFLLESSQPELAAAHLNELIEELYAHSPRALEQSVIESMARLSQIPPPTHRDLAGVARALNANRPRFGFPQIFIDVTTLAERDARTGIQRVTRAILVALISNPIQGWRVEPVRAAGDRFVYARQFSTRCLGLDPNSLKDEPVEARNGDVFLGLDWCVDRIPTLRPWFLEQRNKGVQLFFVTYDMLPILNPELFPPILPPLALDWFKTVVEIADGMICISKTVADQLQGWLAEKTFPRRTSLPIGFFHLGADLQASLPTKGIAPEAIATLEKLKIRPTFLMVGTLEPRKGHQQALEAMELVWATGLEVNLVIMGQSGWHTEELVSRIRKHPELNRRLFWMASASDEVLEKIYQASEALLAPSFGEGFGLPLIEAAQHGLPIIARDIPVFREVAGDCAYYFKGTEPASLASALRAWLDLGHAVPASTGIPWLTWQESSQQLLDVVLRERWYFRSQEAEGRSQSALSGNH
jgi:glycosyltransferase involved in cell wall biosynthesis